jgi:predicted metal-dependent peptidase
MTTIPANIMDREAWTIIVESRKRLLLSHPFWGSLHLRMSFVEDPTCETQWTDGKVQGYNPAWIKGHEIVENMIGLAHEALHVLLGHHLRKCGRIHKLWNVACDYAINQILIDAGFSIPKFYLYNIRFKGMGAEEIYDLLLKEQQQKQEQEEQQKQNQQDQNQDTQDNSDDDQGSDSQEGDQEDGQDEETDSSEVEDNESDSADDQGEDADQEENGDSGADGEGDSDENSDSGNGDDDSEENDEDEGDGQGEGGEAQEDEQGDPGMAGEVRDAVSENGDPLSDAEKAQMESEIKVSAIQAQQQHKALNGSLPEGIERMVKELVDPKLPWREIIWRFAQSAVKSDYSWRKFNARYLALGDYYPGLSVPAIERMILVIDTSISISDQDLKDAASEITGIVSAYPCTVTVLYVDDKLAGVEEFTSQDLPIELHPKGFRCTDFRPAFEWVDNEGIQPTCLIYLTDGECSYYPEEPTYPVLWIGTRYRFEPPFGELVMLHERGF